MLWSACLLHVHEWAFNFLVSRFCGRQEKSMWMFYSTRFWLFPQSAYRIIFLCLMMGLEIQHVLVFSVTWAFQALCIRSEWLWSVYASQVFTKSVPYVIDLSLKLDGGRPSQSPKMRTCATFALTMYSPTSLIQHSIIWQHWYKWQKFCKPDFLVGIYLCNLTMTFLIQHSWTPKIVICKGNKRIYGGSHTCINT